MFKHQNIVTNCAICLKKSHKHLDKPVDLSYTTTVLERAFYMPRLTTSGRITILLGRQQAITGERLTLRRLASLAGVPKDLVYRLDAGQARHVDLDALARLCQALSCEPSDILVWDNDGRDREPV